MVTLVNYGCQKNAQSPISPKSVDSLNLISDSAKTLSINHFRIGVNRQGELYNGNWTNDSSSIGVIFIAGLWIGMQQNGIASGNIIEDGTYPQSNYTTNWISQQGGVFMLDANNAYRTTNWPIGLGAPVTTSGSPKVYGDEMCWSALTSDTTISTVTLLSQPIRGLRVAEALYAYTRSDLEDVVFIRYDITNLTMTTWNNVYIGFYSDTDLGNAVANKTGYDSTRSLSYTYENIPIDSLHRYVTGFTFLQLPKNVGTRTHRIMRKNNYIDPDFGEHTFTSPNQILYALQGLSNSGLPMTNPTTGQQTLFAFTGDPVTGAGWLDTPVDVRSLLASAPFSINSGETVTVTVAGAVSDGVSLADALNKLKSEIDQVRTNITLWQP